MCEESLRRYSGKIAKNTPILIPFIFTLLLLYGCGAGGNSFSTGTIAGNNSVANTNISSNSAQFAILSWYAPKTNADGTPLTDLAGYKVYYGPSSGNYTQTIDVGNATAIQIDSLAAGTWYFAVTAYDSSGNESTFSNEVTKNIS